MRENRVSNESNPWQVYGFQKAVTRGSITLSGDLLAYIVRVEIIDRSFGINGEMQKCLAIGESTT